MNYALKTFPNIDFSLYNVISYNVYLIVEKTRNRSIPTDYRIETYTKKIPCEFVKKTEKYDSFKLIFNSSFNI